MNELWVISAALIYVTRAQCAIEAVYIGINFVNDSPSSMLCRMGEGGGVLKTPVSSHICQPCF